jgi:hypothetical protein
LTGTHLHLLLEVFADCLAVANLSPLAISVTCPAPKGYAAANAFQRIMAHCEPAFRFLQTHLFLKRHQVNK